MNRPVSIALILLAAAGGFAAGWWPLAERESVAASAMPRGEEAPAVATAVVLPNEDAPPSLPELNSVEECREFLRTSGKKFSARHPLTRQAIRDYALRRWLELDAESALQEAERQPGNEFAENGFAPELFRVWLDLNVDSAIEGWTQANPLLAKNVRAAFLSTLADKDPARAFELWKTSRGKSARRVYDPAEEAIFQRWAQQDPKAALQCRDNDLVWGAWIDADPATAYAELKRRNAGDWPPAAGVAVRLFPWLQRESPAEAAQLMAAVSAKEPDSGLNAGTLANSWVARDARGALRWAETQPSQSALAQEVMLAGISHIATSDPEAAIALLRRVDQAPSSKVNAQYDAFKRSYAAREAFASLAAADQTKARELLAADPELAKNGGVAGFLTYAFAGDTATAIQQTREWLREPALKEAAAEGALMAFNWEHGAGARDPSELLAAIPELADKVKADVLSGWAKVNPAGAADFIMERARGGHDISGLTDEGVLAELAIAQPEYTGLWLQRLPDPELQTQAAKTLSANWAAFDPAAAAAWINSLPAGPVRDTATEEFRQQLGSGNSAP